MIDAAVAIATYVLASCNPVFKPRKGSVIILWGGGRCLADLLESLGCSLKYTKYVYRKGSKHYTRSLEKMGY
jgi:hypothetical protein